MHLLRDQMDELETVFPGHLPVNPALPDMKSLDEEAVEETKASLEKLTNHLREQIGQWNRERNRMQEALIKEMGGRESFADFRNAHDNEKLSEMLLNRNELEKIIETDQRLIRKFEPVYMIPTSARGRAHLYAPCKRIGNACIDTIWFNLAFIWFTSLILYLTLYFDVLRKVITTIEQISWKKSG